MEIHPSELSLDNSDTSTLEVATDASKALTQVGAHKGPTAYPKLTSHEGILIRSLAIADNLDEVMLLPQGMLFMLKPALRRGVRRTKIKKTAKAQGSKLDKKNTTSQEDYIAEHEGFAEEHDDEYFDQQQSMPRDLREKPEDS